MKAIALLLITGATILAQTPPVTTCAVVSPEAAKREFDAASVKPAGPFTGTTGGPGTKDSGRVTMQRIDLATLIVNAYDIWFDQVQGPKWINDTGDNAWTITATMPPTTTKEQYCGMLRNLIATRFHLTFHREMQPRPGYELTVMPGGPKFKEYVPGQPGSDPAAGRGQDENGFWKMPPDRPTMQTSSMTRTGVRKESFRNNMAAFARWAGVTIMQITTSDFDKLELPRVIDKTGLTGVYDIRLEYQGPRMLEGPDTPPAAPSVDEGPNIFNAVRQQLGLKLQKVKDVPVEVLVIDHADQTPTEN